MFNTNASRITPSFSAVAVCRRASLGNIGTGRLDDRDSVVRKIPDQAWQYRQHRTPSWSPGVGVGSSSPQILPRTVDHSAVNQGSPLPWRCVQCTESFKWDHQLYDHARMVHRVYLCFQCNQGFNSSANLCYHRNKQHGHNTDLQCTYCGKFFGHKQNMRLHMIKTHRDTSYLQK